MMEGIPPRGDLLPLTFTRPISLTIKIYDCWPPNRPNFTSINTLTSENLHINLPDFFVFTFSMPKIFEIHISVFINTFQNYFSRHKLRFNTINN